MYVRQLKPTHETAIESRTSLSFTSTLLTCTHTHGHSRSLKSEGLLSMSDMTPGNTNMGRRWTGLSFRVEVSGVRQEESKQ